MTFHLRSSFFNIRFGAFFYLRFGDCPNEMRTDGTRRDVVAPSVACPPAQTHTFQRRPREQQWTDHKKQRSEAQPQCVLSLEGGREMPFICVVTRESWCASAPLSLQSSHGAHTKLTKVCFTQNLLLTISPWRKALTLSFVCSKAINYYLLPINY